MQGVHAAALDGAPRRHEGLGRDLAAEHALAALVGAHAPEDVDLDGLDVEQLDEEVQRVAHHPSWQAPAATVCAVPTRPPSPKGSCGGRPPPPTRSRGATSTTTGGPSSTPRARRASSRAATPATRGTGGPRTSSSWRRSGSAPTGSRSSGAGSSPPRASGRSPRSSTTGASAPVPRARALPVVTFNHFTIPAVAGRARRLGGGRRPRALRPVLRAGVASTWATSSAGRARSTSPTWWPPWATWLEVFPPAVRDAERRHAVNAALCRAHGSAVEALRSGPGRLPRRAHLVHARLAGSCPGARSGWSGCAARWRTCSSRPPPATTSSGCSATPGCGSGPTGCSAAEEGVATTQMGYEFWPQALEATVRRAWDVTGGIPVLVTENGIGTADDTQRIAYVTEALDGRAALPRRRDRRPGLLLLEPARQLRVGPRLRPHLRSGRGRPRHLRAPAQAERAVVRGGGPAPTPLP